MATSVFQLYREFPLRRRLFVTIRHLVAPWQRLLDEVKDPEVLVDIGCGDGMFLMLLRERYPQLRAIGIEHDEHKLALAKSLLPGLELYSWAEVERAGLPLADHVTITDVLSGIDMAAWDGIFEFAARSLKPGGYFIIKDIVDRPVWKTWIGFTQEVVATKILRYTKGGMPHLESPQTFEDRLRKHGFVHIEHGRIDQGYPWTHYFFKAQKPMVVASG